jgi:predicted RNase H-like HicB family nuclease
MYIEIYKSIDNVYIAACPELELFSKGDTQKEAVKKLKTNISNYLKSNKELKLDIELTSRFYGLNYPQKH